MEGSGREWEGVGDSGGKWKTADRVGDSGRRRTEWEIVKESERGR